MTFRIHCAVEDLGGIVGSRRQTQQVRFFFLVEIDGPALGFPVQADVGDLGKPESRCLVEVLQRREGAAVEQVGFQVGKGPFDFTFIEKRALQTVAMV